MMMSGAELFSEPCPRTRMEALSLPGTLLLEVTDTPAAIPARPDDKLVIGRFSAMSLMFTEATEPVRFTFFCEA